ncbi:MAG: cytochrome-c peroxidase, partial [Proteobacteria bacterium]
PLNFPEPVYRLADNQITKDGFELGRKLFYEPRLSRNNTVSCGSCHIQSSAFTQHGHDVSHGIDDRLGSRNSPPIMNLAWMPSFFWDGGVFDLDLQPIVPITNHVEMDETVENVLTKLRQHPQYPALFKKAFGTEEINTARTMKALSQFMLTMVSANSKYDKYSRKETGAALTESELRGLTLFKANCSGCHTGELFTDQSFRNNGLRMQLANSKDFDLGRYQITLNLDDYNKFRVPSLRNVERTSPYMHDGRFQTLEQVLEHYINDVQDTPQLDPLLKKTGKPGIALTTTDKADLLAFLRTLTDDEYIRDRRFQPD